MILAEYVLPLAVLVSAAATSATGVFAYQLWRSNQLHDRALFGDEELETPGLIHMVKAHRRVIKREHDLSSEDLYDPD